MKIKTFCTIALLSLIMISCSSHKSDPLSGGNMMFWQVSDDNSSVYLLGSMHFGKAEFYPMPNIIEKSYTGSDLLGVELDLLAMDASALQSEIMTNMAYTDGTDLFDHISPETAKLLTAYFAGKGLDTASFKTMKPGILTMTITALEAQLAGLDAQYGIDMHYLLRAKEDNKPIIEFESIESQIELLFGAEDLAEGMLYNTLKEAKGFQASLDSLSTIWQSGDAKAMNKMLTSAETEEESKYITSLFGDRDTKMTQKIEKLLAEDKTGFIILGAGHFVNDTGIIKRLASTKKYKIVKF